MTEKELKTLGFKKEFTEEGNITDPYYYIYDLYNVCLITIQCSDEITSDEWSVAFFDSLVRYKYSKYEQVKKIIK